MLRICQRRRGLFKRVSVLDLGFIALVLLVRLACEGAVFARVNDMVRFLAVSTGVEQPLISGEIRPAFGPTVQRHLSFSFPPERLHIISCSGRNSLARIIQLPK